MMNEERGKVRTVLLKKLTVNEHVYSELKRMIARRELAPGTPLIIRPLAKQLGVSNMPIIEAIRRLERDGLITVIPKLGATVKEWSRDEILEAYYIRRALEGQAARLFVMRAAPEDKKRLVQLNDIFDKLAASDPVKCDEADIELHLHIVRSTRFRRLYELIENCKIETIMLHGLAIWRPDSKAEVELSYKKSIGCHQPLLEALLGQSPEAAEQAMCQHIDTNMDLIQRIEEKAIELYPLAAAE